MIALRAHTSRGPAALLAALALAAAALAQTPASPVEAELAATRASLADPALSPAARLSLVKRCDDLAEHLIASEPADDRLPTRLVDRASWAIELAGEDGADAAVLYGLPSVTQRRVVAARARDALDLLARADAAATIAATRLERELVKLDSTEQARTRAAAIEAALATLIDAEQSERIPRLRALARLLIGASGKDPADAETLQAAVKEFTARPPATDSQADARAVMLGIALVHTARGTTDRVEETYDAAAALLKPIAKKYDPGAGDASTVALRARLGLLRAGREAPARQRSDNARRERAIDLAEAEARSAAMFDRASREQSARTLLLASAIRTLIDAIKDADEPTRLAAYAKLAAALPAGAPLDRLPPEATLARAVARVRDAGIDDPLAREDASAMLSGLAQRPDASPELRAQARWERAVIAGAAKEPLAETDALAIVVRSDAETERGLAAARRVFDLFARQQGASGLAALDEKWRGRLPALRDALALLVRRDAAGAPRWTSESIRLCIAELQAAEPPAGADPAARALALLETGAGTPPEVAALADALWKHLDRRAAAISSRAAAAEPALRAEWEALVPAARRAVEWGRASGADAERMPMFALILGEALVGIDSAEADAVLGAIAGSSIDRPGASLFTRYRLALARAQRRAGDAARAISTYRDLADRLEGSPGSASPEPAYWAAWSEMLAIMQADNKDHARSGDIRVQIKRLELVDAKLGGPPYADRIRRILAAIEE